MTDSSDLSRPRDSVRSSPTSIGYLRPVGIPRNNSSSRQRRLTSHCKHPKTTAGTPTFHSMHIYSTQHFRCILSIRSKPVHTHSQKPRSISTLPLTSNLKLGRPSASLPARSSSRPPNLRLSSLTSPHTYKHKLDSSDKTTTPTTAASNTTSTSHTFATNAIATPSSNTHIHKHIHLARRQHRNQVVAKLL